MVEPPGVTAVLIDFDGTLVTLPVNWGMVRSDLARLAAGWGIDVTFRSIAEDLRALPERARAIGWSGDRIDEARSSIHGVIRGHELRAVPDAVSMPGSKELLDWARTDAVPIAVVSANCVATIERVFDRLGWPLPSVVVGRESVQRSKPDPEGAIAALRALGVSGAGVVFVGDADHDMLVGAAIGARTFRVAAAVGAHQGAPADVVLASLEELLPILRGRPA